MKRIKDFLRLTGILVFAILIMGGGSLSFSAQAAGEPAAQLETYPLDAESSTAVCLPDVGGMVAYWPFNDGLGQLDDVIKNPAFNNGACTLTGCPTSNLSGKVDSALDFDGNDEVRVANTSGINDFTIDGDFTLETWVKTTQDCTGRSVFVGRYEAENKAAWWLGCIENNVAALHMRDSNAQESTLASTTVINDGQWHHIVGTRDGTGNVNKIYVDGVLENSSNPTFSGELTFGAKDVTIGFFDPDPFYWLIGSLDEMALYNKALSADDIARHYADGAGKSYCQDEATLSNVYLPLLFKNFEQ